MKPIHLAMRAPGGSFALENFPCFFGEIIISADITFPNTRVTNQYKNHEM